MSVDPIQAYRLKISGDSLENRDENLQQLARDIKERVGDPSRNSLLIVLNDCIQLYQNSPKDKADTESDLKGSDNPVVVALREAFFKALAIHYDQPGIHGGRQNLEIKAFMDWLQETDDITLATQLPRKVLLGLDEVANAQSVRAEQETEQVAAQPLTEQETEQATDNAADELEHAIGQMRATASPLVEVPNDMSSLDMEKHTNGSLVELNLVLGKMKMVPLALGYLISAVVVIVCAYIIGIFACFLPTIAYLISALFGLLWCIVFKSLEKLAKGVMKFGPWRNETSVLPDVTGHFEQCMQPFSATAELFGAKPWDTKKCLGRTLFFGNA